VVEAINLKPILSFNQILIAVAASIAVILITLMLLVTGFVGVAFFVAVLMLFAGGYGIAIFLAQQYKIAKQAEQLKQLLNALEMAREQQTGISIKYAALQDNFTSLTEAANREAAEKQRLYEYKIATQEEQFQARIDNALKDVKEREFTAKAIVRSIAIKYLDETKKILIAKLTPDNLSQTQDRFRKAVEFVEKVGFDVPKKDERAFEEDIAKEYAAEVRKQLAREEQARIREKLREEAKAEAEFQREMKRLEQEEKLLERLLAEARAKATAESSAQIEDLERRLAEAKDKERSLSMAQQTKAGNVYVISNIGSFGDGVFKIGMTRRLEPMDRIKELGDASVPFPFDVHMMIACDNAPKMENELHIRFNKHRINKVNFRKEFFRVAIDDIKMAVEELHGEVEYVVDPEALEYRESQTMTDEQFEMVTNISHEAGMDDEDDDAS
ncbi:MAG: GIY-YIG nuclease family protein, partial [bacterium]